MGEAGTVAGPSAPVGERPSCDLGALLPGPAGPCYHRGVCATTQDQAGRCAGPQQRAAMGMGGRGAGGDQLSEADRDVIGNCGNEMT